MTLRKSVFSGSWYPSEPKECESQIQAFLREGQGQAVEATSPTGGIVPHAGWYFSGAIACNVIHNLSANSNADLVVVFGMHMHPGSPLTIMPEGEWETPLGSLAVDTELADGLLARYDFNRESPTRYVQDNTIELQMPFIRYFFPEARVLAMGVPPSGETLQLAESVASLARELGRKMVVIGSTDLTHYGPNYGFTNQGRGEQALEWVTDENDRRVIDAMLRMDAEAVIQEGTQNDNACCSGAAAAAVTAAKSLGAQKGEELAYATSYDKSPGDSFVGYVGVLFS